MARTRKAVLVTDFGDAYLIGAYIVSLLSIICLYKEINLSRSVGIDQYVTKPLCKNPALMVFAFYVHVTF